MMACESPGSPLFLPRFQQIFTRGYEFAVELGPHRVEQRARGVADLFLDRSVRTDRRRRRVKSRADIGAASSRAAEGQRRQSRRSAGAAKPRRITACRTATFF